MAYFSVFSLLILSDLFIFNNAYQIDSSCQGTDVPMLRAAAEQAFDMAQGAYSALNVHTRDQDVVRLIDLLFCADNEDANIKDMTYVMNMFQGILSMRNEKTQSVVEDPGEALSIIIYCNIDRVSTEIVQGTTQFVDTSTYNTLLGSDPRKHHLSTCGSNWRLSDNTLAFTWTAAPKQVNGQRKAFASEVTVCPWFLLWARERRYKTWSDIVTKAQVASFLIPIGSTFNIGIAPIDALNLLDKVFLHEFTHTIVGGNSDDVDLAIGPDDTSNAAYGWGKIVTLAKQNRVTQRYAQTTPLAFTNADSLALFGSAIRLLAITASRAPVYVNEDGTLANKNPRAKREIPPELQYPDPCRVRSV